jgi:Uncharacterized protein conserved in bacteria (DUF2252)
MDRPSEHRYAAPRLDERRAEGAEWRQQLPLSANAEWKAPPDRPDPVEILIGRGTDPFAFLPGAAAIMAADLASGPTTGLRIQACGDCYLANFGAYASPEGTPIIDVKDFDETLPAPFEWDVKRLAASLAVAGRVAGASDREARLLARTATKNYRRHWDSWRFCPHFKPGARVSISPAPLPMSTPQRSGATPKGGALPRYAGPYSNSSNGRTAIGGLRTSRH